MRPAGEIREAILAACHAMTTPERAATLAELCQRANVSRSAATSTLKNLVRSGVLTIPRTRKVPYRNKPVAEYAPATATRASIVDLGTLLAAWGRQAG
jgi:predicted transcriptional regulator